jgi:hypothetical protein
MGSGFAEGGRTEGESVRRMTKTKKKKISDRRPSELRDHSTRERVGDLLNCAMGPERQEDEDAWMTTWEPSEFLRSIQLTPEQREELRAQAQKEIDRARAAGVYEWLASLGGKVTFELDDSEVRDGD